MTSALYFPYIKVPQSEWFARALLYWDGVSAIVPMDYWRNPERLGPYMVDLMREGLVTAVAPAAHVGGVQNFTADFISYLRDNHPQRLERRYVMERWPRVHIEKLIDLGEELERVGLARRADGFWYQVEPHTAQEFMAYLAGVLSACSADQMVPVTDERLSLNGFGQIDRGARLNSRSVVLEGVLPTPRPDTPARELREFKERYGAQLRAFRRRVEGEVENLLSIENDVAKQERSARLIASLNEEIAEVAEQLALPRYGGLVSFGSLCAMGAVGLPAVDALLAGNKFGIAAGALGLFALVNEARNARAGSPLAYAATARQLA